MNKTEGSFVLCLVDFLALLVQQLMSSVNKRNQIDWALLYNNMFLVL
jgi:hypothetical protein